MPVAHRHVEPWVAQPVSGGPDHGPHAGRREIDARGRRVKQDRRTRLRRAGADAALVDAAIDPFEHPDELVLRGRGGRRKVIGEVHGGAGGHQRRGPSRARRPCAAARGRATARAGRPSAARAGGGRRQGRDVGGPVVEDAEPVEPPHDVARTIVPRQAVVAAARQRDVTAGLVQLLGDLQARRRRRRRSARRPRGAPAGSGRALRAVDGSTARAAARPAECTANRTDRLRPRAPSRATRRRSFRPDSARRCA